MWGAEGNGSAVSNICVSATGPGPLRAAEDSFGSEDVVPGDEGIRASGR